MKSALVILETKPPHFSKVVYAPVHNSERELTYPCFAMRKQRDVIANRDVRIGRTYFRLSLWITTYLRMRHTTPPVYLEL